MELNVLYNPYQNNNNKEPYVSSGIVEDIQFHYTEGKSSSLSQDFLDLLIHFGPYPRLLLPPLEYVIYSRPLKRPFGMFLFDVLDTSHEVNKLSRQSPGAGYSQSQR